MLFLLKYKTIYLGNTILKIKFKTKERFVSMRNLSKLKYHSRRRVM